MLEASVSSYEACIDFFVQKFCEKLLVKSDWQRWNTQEKLD